MAKAREIRGNKKISELHGEQREAYDTARQEARDFLANDFKKNLTEGEQAAYDILSRKLSDYLPHLFDKAELKELFLEELNELRGKLDKTTNKSVITRYKNRINELETALKNMEQGKYINFRKLPKNVFFRFFNERKGAKGYSYSAMKAFEAYIHGIARKMYDEPALRKAAAMFDQVSPELRPYMKELIDYYMDYGPRSKAEWLARQITTLEWMRTLGLNPRSALVNLTQMLNTAAWVGEKYAIKAHKMIFSDKAKADALFESQVLNKKFQES